MRHSILRLSVLIFFMMTMETLSASTNNEKLLIEEGKVWQMLYSNVEASDIYPDYEYSYYIEGDTIVAGKDCKKLYSHNKNNDEDIIYEMAVYEEDNKVYYAPSLHYRFYILYDWGCEIGGSCSIDDTVHPESMPITIDIHEQRSITVCNITYSARKISRRAANDEEEYPSGWWIEGIGSEGGLLNTWGFESIGNHHHLIRCEADGEIIFTTSEFREAVSSLHNVASDKESHDNDAAIYDLSGKRLPKVPDKGVYIEHGKKKIGKGRGCHK